MIVIHHAPGWDEWSKEVVRKFAYHGYMAISPNLYHRFGPELSPDDAAAAARAGGWVPPISSSAMRAARWRTCERSR